MVTEELIRRAATLIGCAHATREQAAATLVASGVRAEDAYLAAVAGSLLVQTIRRPTATEEKR